MLTPAQQARGLLVRDIEEKLKDLYPDRDGWRLSVSPFSLSDGGGAADEVSVMVRISKPKGGWPEVAVGPDGETGDEDDWERGEGSPPPGWEKRGDEC